MLDDEITGEPPVLRDQPHLAQIHHVILQRVRHTHGETMFARRKFEFTEDGRLIVFPGAGADDFGFDRLARRFDRDCVSGSRVVTGCPSRTTR